jgi:hypothetical protein
MLPPGVPTGSAPQFNPQQFNVPPSGSSSYGLPPAGIPSAQQLPPAYGGPSSQPVGTPSVPPASTGSGVYRPGSVGRSTNYDFSGASATR